MSESSVLPSHGSYLLPQFEHATVADAMHPGILSCDAEATLTEVARMMSTHHVHCILVTGAGEGGGDDSPVWGVISDFDVLRARMRPDAPDAASNIAQQPVIRVEATAALRDAAELMLTKGNRSRRSGQSPDPASGRDPVDPGHRGCIGMGRDVNSHMTTVPIKGST